MTPEELRRVALALPEAHEEPHFERTSFRAGNKIFATMTADGLEAMVKVSDAKRLQELLKAQPATFFSYGKWTVRYRALGVRLARADDILMRELLTNSWRVIATKRALAEFERSHGTAQPQARRAAKSRGVNRGQKQRRATR